MGFNKNMTNNPNKKSEKYVKRYQKPIFEKQEQMMFPIEIMEKFNGGRFCLQCSGCHGCR